MYWVTSSPCPSSSSYSSSSLSWSCSVYGTFYRPWIFPGELYFCGERRSFWSGEVFRKISSKAKHLFVPPLKRSFNFFLKGELVVEVSPPPELGSWMCLKLSRIGFTADITSAAGFKLTLISDPRTESKGGFDSVASSYFSFSLLLTFITVCFAIAYSSN